MPRQEYQILQNHLVDSRVEARTPRKIAQEPINDQKKGDYRPSKVTHHKPDEKTEESDFHLSIIPTGFVGFVSDLCSSFEPLRKTDV